VTAFVSREMRRRLPWRGRAIARFAPAAASAAHHFDIDGLESPTWKAPGDFRARCAQAVCATPCRRTAPPGPTRAAPSSKRAFQLSPSSGRGSGELRGEQCRRVDDGEPPAGPGSGTCPDHPRPPASPASSARRWRRDLHCRLPRIVTGGRQSPKNGSATSCCLSRPGGAAPLRVPRPPRKGVTD